MIILLVKSTGLYFGRLEKCNSFLQYAILFRVAILCALTLLFTIYSLYLLLRQFLTAVDVKQLNHLNLGFLLKTIWLLQSMVSMVFLIHWQIRNHLYSISKTLFTTLRKQASHCKDHTKLKRNLRATLVSCLVIAVAYCIVQVSHFTIVYSIDYYKTSLQRIIFFNHSAICAYGFCVTNIVLCAFIVVTKSIALELDRFNRIFPKMCIPSASTSANLLKSMATHNQLAEKISKADKIFQGYLMSMMAILSPAIIISFITLLRREDWLGVLYSLNDILCCSFQLFALTYNPAQIYTKFRAARDQVHKISANLIEYDMKACQIAQIFANNVAHSHVGFSLGGHTVITKSLILTMMSLVFPYVILCLQLNLGTTFYTFYQPTSTHNPTN